MKASEIYWYGRGYYDGRHHGYEASIDALVMESTGNWEPETKAAYLRGYDCGVADYCEMDIEEVA